MAVPKRKHSKARRDTRRNTHWKLSVPSLSACPACGAAKLPHRVCKACGQYKGRTVLAVAEAE